MALTKVTGSVIKDSVSLSGNVSVGGTLTYQDVTNVDALGIGTFRTGIKVLAGQVDVGSNIKLGNAGVVTATSFVGSSGLNVLDGRVKIGTTSNTPAAANEPGIVFGDNTAGTATKGIASFCANGAAPLLLTRRVSDGNVLGIADDTTTRGMLRVTSNDLEITAIEELRLSTGAGHNEKIRLTNAGRFGLGVTGPDAMLHVKGSDNVLGLFESTDADSLIQFKDNSTSDTILMGALGGDDLLLRCDAGNIVFHVANNNEKFRITSAGHLQLQGGTIYGDDSALPTFTLQNTSGNNNHCKIILGNSVGADNGGIEFWTAGSSVATKKFSIRGNNNYIEVMGSNTLRFNDGKLNVSHDGSDGYITNNTGDLKLRTNNAERLEITNAGLIQAKTLSGSYYVIASVKDGSTSARAATSAWEIKKTLGPRAKTGYYYLINPYDGTTNTWWCDMTTDGGGWILVAHTGEGQMSALSTADGNHWYNRSNKGGFDTVGSGYYKGGGYWRATNGAWAANTCGQLMWSCYTNSSQYDNYGVSKVVFNWGTDQPLPSGASGYGNIPNAGNRRFNEWCYEVVGAPGFNPDNYHQNQRSNVINGNTYFTEHMVMTWSFRGTGGAGDAGSDGPYWQIGAHHDGLHQHYEESIQGSDGVYGDGGYLVVSNEDTSWGSGASNGGYPRIGRHVQSGGNVNVWLR
tara:strand:- start:675 stop:2735 length:2061 start_codon:yes stop_codon:yes gene_type:complete